MMVVAALTGILQQAASPWSLIILSVYMQLSLAQTAICPSRCLCAADLLSCADLDQVPRELPVFAVTLDFSHNRIQQLEANSFEGLHSLKVLRLAHNQVSVIQPGAFRNSSGSALRHLDLSSNRLLVVKQRYFQDLPGLEELLLFNNQIVRVESAALTGLNNLRKVYLSHNRLTHFPFSSVQGSKLSMLDLSSNRLPTLPQEDILNLPRSIQEGLYLHNNSLECDCSMFSLFSSWEQKGFDTVQSFLHEHRCLIGGVQENQNLFLKYRRFFDNCKLSVEQESSVEVRAGSTLLLHCDTSLSGRRVTFAWLAPNLEYVAPPGNNSTFKMFTNGSLEIVAAQTQDSGTFVCIAQDQQHIERLEVNVTVLLHHEADDHEPFNTGFTTLLGCVVSLVLVLMYLYLTPCRCPTCPRPRPPIRTSVSQAKEAGVESAQSSILSPTPPTTTEGPGRKVSTNKHVVFLEPIREQQNGRLRAGPGLLLGAEPQQQSRETSSYMAIFSDSPIMLP